MKTYTQTEVDELLDRQVCETTSQILKNQPTWEDVRKAIVMANEREFFNGVPKYSKYTEEEIIGQLKQEKR